MEKDIGKLEKNPETDIIVRIDSFGGKAGLTIREFVHSERYTGFTKAGVRIRAEDFDKFKGFINAVEQNDLIMADSDKEKLIEARDDDDAGIDDNGLM